MTKIQKSFMILIIWLPFMTGPLLFAQGLVKIETASDYAKIENNLIAIEFDLTDGTYSGIDKSDNTLAFKDAWYRIGPGGWKEPVYEYSAEKMGPVTDNLGSGEKIRVWYKPLDSYDPIRFLDITVYESSPFFVIGWGVKNNKEYTIRARTAEVVLNGMLFENQKVSEPRVLRGGAGAEPNFVESTWEISAHNSAMLTYKDNFSNNRRRTIVAGGLHYSEYMRTAEFHSREKSRRTQNSESTEILKQSFITLAIHDPQGKRVEPGEMWVSKDSYFVDIATSDPFESLEGFGKMLAVANDAHPNPYDFPTLCGWMSSGSYYSQVKIPENINNTTGLIEQMQIAIDNGITKYTPVALRLEPDYYCYNSDGNTQQGWWDDEHWAKYGDFFQKPYETFAKFGKQINSMGGKVFTYIQASMPSNDFALAHPDWMLNDDISLLYEDHPHARPFIRFDYTNPDFQDHTLEMWKRLRKDGVVGIKYDYPHTGWPKDGGFDDETYTTVSAYRKIYELSREGLGKDAYIHERIMGFALQGVPRTDCTIGLVDLQRVWPDASHFEPEMASRIGLRWYKQGVAVRYYPDGKSFYRNGEPLSQMERRTFLTLVGLLSGRIEMGSSFGTMTEEMGYDLTRLFPVLPNGKAFRPTDFLLGKEHPEVYVYEVNEDWKQVILVNNDVENYRGGASRKVIAAPLSGDQANTGSLGLEPKKEYYVFDFWSQKPMGIIQGNKVLSAELKAGEARVYAVKQVLDHPRILGTNRHVMCGMMEIADEFWDEQESKLSFKANIVGEETMQITIAVPVGSDLQINDVRSDSKDTTFEQDGQFIVLSVSSKNNILSNIELFF